MKKSKCTSSFFLRKNKAKLTNAHSDIFKISNGSLNRFLSNTLARPDLHRKCNTSAMFCSLKLGFHLSFQCYGCYKISHCSSFLF